MGFFMNLCFAKCEKLSFFFWHFFGCFSKNTIKIGILAHFSKQKITKKNGIFGSYYLVQVGSYYLVQVDCVFKNANLDQIITSKIFARNFFPKKRAETPIFIVFFGNRCFGKKTNLDQIITSKTAKLGPENNSTAYIYIYMCIENTHIYYMPISDYICIEREASVLFFVLYIYIYV